MWVCRCICGNTTTVTGTSLTSGCTRSCGCLHLEVLHTGVRPKIHGKTKTPIYITWINMRRRCNDPKDASFPSYGGRGISVCPEWDSSFLAFYSDMGDIPPGKTLDRIDVNEGYSVKNCRWASMQEQGRNRRSNRLVEAFGRVQTLTAWAEEFEIPISRLRLRLHRGWPPEKALQKKKYETIAKSIRLQDLRPL